MLRLAITPYEQGLLDDIEEIGYGELYGVKSDDKTPSRMIDSSDRYMHFIRELRKLGEFAKVVIHDSEPTLAEFPSTTKNGRHCLKRIKF